MYDSIAQSDIHKIIFMGLSQGGKSSIYSVVFEGIDPKELEEFSATKNYFRSNFDILQGNFQIVDCGGQIPYLSVFLGEREEFIFSNVAALIWVVDIANSNDVSSSKHYFDQALEKIYKRSPKAKVYCLLHKSDKIEKHLKENVLHNMESFFKPLIPGIETEYFGTSIYDQSIFNAVGKIFMELISDSKNRFSATLKIKELLDKISDSIKGLVIYTRHSLPLFKAGSDLEILENVTNIFSPTFSKIEKVLEQKSTFNCIYEAQERKFAFYAFDDNTLLAGSFSSNIQKSQINDAFNQINDIIKEIN